MGTGTGTIVGEPSRPPGTPRPGARRVARRPTWITWTILALVAIPILVSALSRAIGGWVPEGDDAWVARRTMQVFSTDPPLIGQESTSDRPDSPLVPNHPGPVGYYVVAVPYALSGWSPVGFLVGFTAIVIAAVATGVVLASRVAGDRGAVAVGIALVAVMARLGPNWTVRPLNSSVVLFPLVATLLGVWAYLRRDRVGLGVVAIAGSFCIQVSLVALPLAAAAVITCGIVALVRSRREGPRPPLSASGWVAIAAVSLMWLPPLLDLGLHWPGNLGELAHYFLGQVGVVSDESAKSSNLGLGPALASTVSYLAGVPGLDQQDLGPSFVQLVEPGDLALVPLVVGLVVVAATGWFAHRRGSAALRSLGTVAVGSFVAGVASLSRRPTDSLFTQTYFAISIQSVVVLGWATIALAGLEALLYAADRMAAGRATAVRYRRAPVLGGVALIAMVSVLPVGGPIDRDDSKAVASLSHQIRDRVPSGTYYLLADGFVPFVSTVKGVGADLLAHGWDIRFQEFGGMEDETSRRGDDQMARLVITSERPDEAGRDVVARTEIGDEVLLVRLVPPGPLATWCDRAVGFDLSVHRAAGVGRDRDAVAALDTPDEWQAVVDSLDPVALAEGASGDPAVERAVEVVASDQAELAAALRAGAVEEPPAVFRRAIGTLEAAYTWTCDARLVTGTSLLSRPAAPR